MKYNMKAIMSKAWHLFKLAAKKVAISFSEACARRLLFVRSTP